VIASIVGAVLLLGAAVGVLAATGTFSSSDSATTSSIEDNGHGFPPPPTTSTTQTTTQNVTRSDVRAVLDRYVSAYTAHDAAGLKALFSPTFTRTTDNKEPMQLDEAMGEYRKQFRQFPDSVYHLNVVDVKPGTDDGSAAAIYTISNAGAAPSKGSIGFHMSRDAGGDLKIDAIAIKTD
jgi:hypothetical protein